MRNSKLKRGERSVWHYFLAEDMKVLEQKIEDLRKRMKELGKEQGVAAGQGSENMGHDDAVQETVYYDRTVVMGQLRELGRAMHRSTVFTPTGPFDKVRIGATVELSDGRTYRIGSYMVFAEHPTPNISYDSPLGKALIAKEEGDEIHFQGHTFTITKIS